VKGADTATPRVDPRRRRRRRLGERIVEAALGLSALSAVVATLLIFAFVAREALPLFGDVPRLRALLRATEGGHVWQPVGAHPKLDVVPLLVGSLKITTMTMLIAAPLAVAAALSVSEVLGARARRVLAPLVEMLAGVPSVVLGLVAASCVAPAFQSLLQTTYASNALVASVALSVAVAPVVFAVSLDGFLAVPRELREASFALGAHRYQTALHVVLPAATPAVVASLTLGFGRAIGETMIVLMTSGNAAVADLSPTSGARTITATIAAELGEAEQGSEHWRVLFLLGLALVTFTLVLDWAGRATATAVARRRTPKPAALPTRAAEAT
jgi:phosphate transport system permease protein